MALIRKIKNQKLIKGIQYCDSKVDPHARLLNRLIDQQIFTKQGIYLESMY